MATKLLEPNSANNPKKNQEGIINWVLAFSFLFWIAINVLIIIFTGKTLHLHKGALAGFIVGTVIGGMIIYLISLIIYVHLLPIVLNLLEKSNTLAHSTLLLVVCFALTLAIGLAVSALLVAGKLAIAHELFTFASAGVACLTLVGAAFFVVYGSIREKASQHALSQKESTKTILWILYMLGVALFGPLLIYVLSAVIPYALLTVVCGLTALVLLPVILYVYRKTKSSFSLVVVLLIGIAVAAAIVTLFIMVTQKESSNVLSLLIASGFLLLVDIAMIVSALLGRVLPKLFESYHDIYHDNNQKYSLSNSNDSNANQEESVTLLSKDILSKGEFTCFKSMTCKESEVSYSEGMYQISYITTIPSTVGAPNAIRLQLRKKASQKAVDTGNDDFTELGEAALIGQIKLKNCYVTLHPGKEIHVMLSKVFQKCISYSGIFRDAIQNEYPHHSVQVTIEQDPNLNNMNQNDSVANNHQSFQNNSNRGINIPQTNITRNPASSSSI